MNNLTLKELPPPLPGKTGWLWTEECQETKPTINSFSLPRISIVTPSYNYGQFIEETIRSVLLQNYQNLDYIIIDGGSTDNTVEIIRKYEKYLTYWVSEPDKGQTDAINKGYQHCTGDIFAWLNADDSYINSTCLHNVATLYQQGYELIVGEFSPIDPQGNKLQAYLKYGKSIPVTFRKHLNFWSCQHLPQPATFVANSIANSCFPLDSRLKIVMDYQFFLRVLKQNPSSIWTYQTWVNFKYHGQNKSLGNSSPGFDMFGEISDVALSESFSLSNLDLNLFKIDLEDYRIIYNFLHGKKKLNVSAIVLDLCSRPTLIRWSIFWKLLTKTLLGERLYSGFKRILLKNYVR